MLIFGGGLSVDFRWKGGIIRFILLALVFRLGFLFFALVCM